MVDVIPLLRERLAGPPGDLHALATSHAAVAAILRGAGDTTEVLLIRRQERENDPWSGHMAFPGGHRDVSDLDLLATVLRETREEVGLDLSTHGELLGRLDDLPAVAKGKRTGMVITPFVFGLHRDADLVPSDHEVKEVLWARLEDLMSGARNTTHRIGLPASNGVDQHFDMPAFDVDGRVVWGLTHRMLESLFEVIRSGRAPREDHHG